MNLVAFQAPTLPSARNMGRGLLMLAVMMFGLLLAFPSLAVNNGTNLGALSSAVNTLTEMGPAVKTIIAFVGFVVALISLASLRSMGPALFFIGLAIFGAVGLAIATQVMGADLVTVAALATL